MDIYLYIYVYKKGMGKKIDIKRMGKNKYITGKMYIMGKYMCTLWKLYI